MKKIIALLLAAVMVMCLFAGCASSGGSKVIKIGVFEPQSGDNGAGGKQEVLGIQYANSVKPTVTINGEEYKIELDIQDNQSSTDKAVSAAQQLVADKVSVVLGSYGSGVSIAAGTYFANAKIPAIGCSCTNAAVTAGNDYYFRVCFLDPFQGTVHANYAYKEMGATKAYTLAMLGSDYDQGLVYYFSEAFKGLGGEVVSEDFPEGNANFVSYINNAKSAGAGVIFAPVSTNYAQLIIEAAGAQGFEGHLLGSDTWDNNMVIESAKGKSVNIGNPGSGNRQNAIDVFEAAGINVEKDLKAESIKAADAPRMVQDGRIDGFFYTVGHPNGNIKEATAGKRKCRIVSIPDIEPLVKKFPYYSLTEIDMSQYPEATNAKEKVVTVGMLATFVTSAKVPDDVVYAVTKEVFENLDEFKKLHPALSGLTREGMLQGLTAPIHPGAMKYYKEVGLMK